MPIVNIPEIGRVNFPDDMPEDQIKAQAAKLYASRHAPPIAPDLLQQNFVPTNASGLKARADLILSHPPGSFTRQEQGAPKTAIQGMLNPSPGQQLLMDIMPVAQGGYGGGVRSPLASDALSSLPDKVRGIIAAGKSLIPEKFKTAANAYSEASQPRARGVNPYLPNQPGNTTAPIPTAPGESIIERYRPNSGGASPTTPRISGKAPTLQEAIQDALTSARTQPATTGGKTAKLADTSKAADQVGQLLDAIHGGEAPTVPNGGNARGIADVENRVSNASYGNGGILNTNVGPSEPIRSSRTPGPDMGKIVQGFEDILKKNPAALNQANLRTGEPATDVATRLLQQQGGTGRVTGLKQYPMQPGKGDAASLRQRGNVLADMISKYQKDPSSVPEPWRSLFSGAMNK